MPLALCSASLAGMLARGSAQPLAGIDENITETICCLVLGWGFTEIWGLCRVPRSQMSLEMWTAGKQQSHCPTW
ncbi:hypothetical protein ASPACDRAFT_81664 [Aspergillus aculeatus ATCC 16872]|uniref:Secreted protein n=1 Tax=Aspergillus aculeatus (strain ATCC 16872 / CBS 172.66 / WB 5094) TaxID=690307 RepID=A0A1L9WIE6_ASPA1|nr:uncharacterized protein ASPACDRAFT_81664 [Aspergillus aculeatus ATCC 16872]OJJ95916.1 hypothetical protein ASPACDRAFT_81664 [Aspergillus aculeatus ATCC 16872]